jgi:hypothetical protein
MTINEKIMDEDMEDFEEYTEDNVENVIKNHIAGNVDNECFKILKNRLEYAINITTKMFLEYKNIPLNQSNRIEFLQFTKDKDGINECNIDEIDKLIFKKVEHIIDSNNKFDNDSILVDNSEEINLSDADITRLLDMISRVMITRVIKEPFNKIDDIKNDITYIFRKGIYKKMKNIKEFVSYVSLLSDKSVLECDKNIKKSILDLYTCFDVFCSMSESISSTKEFRYDLQKNLDFNKINSINSIDELFRLTDVIYYHSLDSNITVDMEEGKITFPKYCRCRSDSFMPNQSITKSVGKHVFQKYYVFTKLQEALNNKKMKYISQIELIRSSFDNGLLSNNQKHYLRNILVYNNYNVSDKIVVENYSINTVAQIETSKTNKYICNRPKYNRSNYPKNTHSYDRNINRSKSNRKNKTADSDMQWRKK